MPEVLLSGSQTALGGVTDAAKTVDAGLHAGEPGSGLLLETSSPARATIINTIAAITINGGVVADTLLRKIVINTALAGTLTITGFQDKTGTAQSFVLPIGTPAGSYDFGDALNDKGALIVTLSAAGDANRVVIVWVEA